jgi:hypothetical protein
MAKKVDVEIDVSVKGDKSIKDLNDNIGQSDEKFTSLRRQIRETTVNLQAMADAGEQGSKEFKKLSDHLDELQDQQKRVAFQSSQIEDKLAALPGPIGNIGKSFADAKQNIDTFGVGLTAALGVVALIVGAFIYMQKALASTEEGQKKLNKITESFEKIMNGLFAVIEPIANVLADLVVKLLSNKEVMDALGKTVGVVSGVLTGLLEVLVSISKFVIDVFVNSFKTLITVVSSAGKVLEGVFTFDYDLIKQGVSEGLDGVKAGITKQVEAFKDLGKGIYKGVVDGIDAASTASDNFAKGLKRKTKQGLEDAAKELAEQQKLQDAKYAMLNAELAKRKEIAMETAFNEEQKLAVEMQFGKEEYELKDKQLAGQLALLNQYGDKSKAEVRAQITTLNAERIKGDADYRGQVDANGKKLLDIYKANGKAIQDFEIQLAKDLQKVDDDILAKKIKALQDELVLLGAQQKSQLAGTKAWLDTTLKIEKNAYDQKILNAKGNATLLKAIELEHAQNVKDIQLQAFIAEKQLAIERAGVIAGIGNSLQTLAGKNKEVAIAGIVITKAAGIAEIILNTQIANAKALATLGPIAGPIWVAINDVAAGLSIAAAVKSAADGISQINSVETPGSAGAGASSAGVTPTYAGTPSTSAPIVNTQGGANPATQISQTIQNSNQQPIRAYVVSGDISTQQQLDRKVNRGATFGLG